MFNCTVAYLYGAQSIKKVRIVINTSSNAPIIMLALFHKLYNALLVHDIQLAHEIHGSKAPVDAIHSEVFGHAELVIILVSSISSQETGMLGQLKAWNVAIFWQNDIIHEDGLSEGLQNQEMIL